MRVFVVVLGLVLPLLGCGMCGRSTPRPPAPLDPVTKTAVFRKFCSDSDLSNGHKPDPDVSHPSRAGLLESRFIRSPEYHKAWKFADPEFQATQDIPALRSQLLVHWFEQFKRDNSRSWLGESNFHPLLGDAAAFARRLSSPTDVLSSLIVLYEHEAWSDCVAKDYHYRVAFWVPQDVMDAFPEQARAGLVPFRDRIIREELARLRAGPVTLQMDELYSRLLGEPGVRAAWRVPGLQPYTELLTYLPPDSVDFLGSLLGVQTAERFFRPGGYELPAMMRHMLEGVVLGLANLPPSPSGYNVAVVGHADSTPIDESRPPRYRGNAILTLRLLETRDYKADDAILDANLMNNLALSVVRGHVGAEALSKLMNAAMPAEQRSRFSVLYAGGGVVPGKPIAAARNVLIRVSPR